MSYCDSTKKEVVKDVDFITPIRKYTIKFKSDNNTQAQFLYELRSPDDNLRTYGIYHYIKAQDINGILS